MILITGEAFINCGRAPTMLSTFISVIFQILVMAPIQIVWEKKLFPRIAFIKQSMQFGEEYLLLINHPLRPSVHVFPIYRTYSDQLMPVWQSFCVLPGYRPDA